MMFMDRFSDTDLGLIFIIKSAQCSSGTEIQKPRKVIFKITIRQ